MIAVDRTSVPKPSALDGDDSKAAKELQKARLHFQQKKDGSFHFKIYKDATVKQALEKLFQGKCAYCETVYAANQPVDIEHYRPKNGYVANGSLVKPGYWWLAAEWDNLLPSCIDCNRSRKQEDGDGKVKRLGKANQFPIADESKRAKSEGDEKDEKRLLLDPCRDRPDRCLKFGEKGEVKAQDGLSELEKKMVEASKTVYGLNRNGLATRRHDLAVDLGGKMTTVSNAAQAWKQNQSATGRTELADVVRQLLRKRDAKAAYAGLARQTADPVLAKLRKFVEHHFGQQLKNKSGEPDDVLERFVERFATKETVTSQAQSALDALEI